MTAAPLLRIGGTALDPDRSVLRCTDGTVATLRPKTLELLLLLHRHAGRVVTRGEILDALWPDLHVTDDSVTQCVVELRRALGPDAVLLRTVAKRGYLLEPQATNPLPQAISPPPQVTLQPLPLATVPAEARCIPVVALLPFRLLPPEPDLALVAEGILDGIVGALAGLREPVVISANSTRHLAAEVDLPSAGQRLGAQYVTAGTLRRGGDRLRLTIELAEAQAGSVLWQRAYDLVDAQLFEAQDRIAAIIAHTLAPRVREAELASALRSRPGDLGAYHLLLQARKLIFRLERSSFEVAGGLLRQAAARDPGAASIPAVLADWHSLRLGQGWSDDPVGDQLGLEFAVEAALALDGRHPRALAMLGHNRAILARSYGQAMNLFDRALDAAPNDAETWMWSSPTYAFLGESGEAVRRAERAISLSPEDPLRFRYQCFAAIAHYAAEDFESAASWARRSVAANPNYTSALRIGIGAMMETGAQEEARQMAARVRVLEPEFRVVPFIERQAFRDEAVRSAYGRRLQEAGLPA